MVDFVGFMQGYQDQQEKDDRKRVELAQAFNDFKAANPYATAIEFQSFIDQVSGGRNYLRGGMPGGEVIKAIADRNAKELAQKRLTNQLSNLRSRNQIFGELTASADTILRNLPADAKESDVTAAYGGFVEQLGGQGALPSGFNANQLFTMQRLNLLRREDALKYVDDAVSLIQSSGGIIDRDVLKNTYMVPDNLLDGVIEMARTKYNMNQHDWKNQNQDRLRNIALNELEAGRPDGVKSVLTEDAKLYGYELDEDYVNSLADDAQRIYDERQKDRENARDLKVTEMKIGFKSALDNNQMFANAIRIGNLDLARQIAQSYVRQYDPDVQPTMIDEIDVILNEQIQNQQVLQDDLLGQVRDKANAAMPEIAKNLREANTTAATNHFGTFAKPNKNTGVHEGMAVLAITDVAKTHELTPANLVAIQTAWDAIPEQTDRVQLAAVARAVLEQSGANTLTDAIAQGQELSRAKAGDFGGDITFDTWLGRTTSELENQFNNAERAIEKAINEPDPNKRNAMLDGALAKWNRVLAIGKQEINFAREHSYGERTWITYGTPGWNEDSVTGENGVSTKLDNMTARIVEAVQAGKVNVASQNGSTGNGTPAGQTVWEQATDSGFSGMFTNPTVNIYISMVRDKLAPSITDMGMNPFQIFSDDLAGMDATEYAEKKRVSDWFNTNEEYIRRYFYVLGDKEGKDRQEEELKKFAEDPEGYARTHMQMAE